VDLISPLFFEGGIDITQTLMNAGVTNLPCFSSFLEETRSSQSTTAVLKDFLLGQFALCSVSITKTCSGNGTVAGGGTTIDYLFTGTVTDTGIGGLNHVTIVDSLPAGSSHVVFKQGTPGTAVTAGPANTVVASAACPAGYPVGAVCADLGALGAGQVENWSVEFDVAATSAQNSASARGSSSSSAPGACTAGGTVCSPTDGLASCSADVTNTITISKSCGVPTGFPNAVLPGTQLTSQGGFAAVVVNFSGVIDNTGQTPLTGVTLTDSPAATLTVAWPGTPGTIPAGTSVNYSGTYSPAGSAILGDGTTTGRYQFMDQIKVTGATASLGSNPGHPTACVGTFNSDAQACGTATCGICPFGSNCSGN
jgi:hypothetical protein